MIHRILLILVGLLVAQPCLSIDANESTSAYTNQKKIRKLVQHLGIEADPATPFFDSDAYQVITEELADAPHEAAKWLISELQPVSHSPIYRYKVHTAKERKQLHIAWCLRALRFLTGNEFKAKTNKILRFDPEENIDPAVFLYGHSPAPDQTAVPIPFASEWPSRMRIYFAPRDAQTKIIKQWRDWFKAEGSTFKPALLDREQVDWVY